MVFDLGRLAPPIAACRASGVFCYSCTSMQDATCIALLQVRNIVVTGDLLVRHCG